MTSGKAPPKVGKQTRDWAAEIRRAEAIAEGSRDRATGLRAMYTGMVERHIPSWSAGLAALLPSQQGKTREALLNAQGLLERVLASVDAATNLAVAEGGSAVALPYGEVRAALDGLQAAVDLVGREQCAGVNLSHPPMTPSWRDREQLAASVRAGVIDSSGVWLADLERREGYKLSEFTHGLGLTGLDGPTSEQV